jgi:hypothetical protein
MLWLGFAYAIRLFIYRVICSLYKYEWGKIFFPNIHVWRRRDFYYINKATIYVAWFFWESSNPAYKFFIFCFPTTVGYTPAAYKSSPPSGPVWTFNVRPINCRPLCIRPAKYMKLVRVATSHLYCIHFGGGCFFPPSPIFRPWGL